MALPRRAAVCGAALVGLLVVAAYAAPALAQQKCEDLPRPTGYVVDEARVVDDAVEQQVTSLLSTFEAASDGSQVAVLVVRSIGDRALEDYANDVFGCWGVGANGEDTGVLLVVTVEQRRLRIEVGRGLEDELTDVEAADIIRDVITPHFKAGDYGSGVRDGVEAIVRVLGGGAVGLPLQPVPSPPAGPSPLLLLGLLFGGFALMSMVGARGGRRRGGLGGGMWPPIIIGGGGFGGGSGGFGGGGGGGFGGFGGGGSGGGGASGGW